jgi:hypothetical protein
MPTARVFVAPRVRCACRCRRSRFGPGLFLPAQNLCCDLDAECLAGLRVLVRRLATCEDSCGTQPARIVFLWCIYRVCRNGRRHDSFFVADADRRNLAPPNARYGTCGCRETNGRRPAVHRRCRGRRPVLDTQLLRRTRPGCFVRAQRRSIFGSAIIRLRPAIRDFHPDCMPVRKSC